MNETYKILGREFNRYDYQILDCASDLHSSVCGTGDRLPSELALITYNFIKARLDHWQDSYGYQFVQYDEAVKNLCYASIRLYEASGHLVEDSKYYDEHFGGDE